MNASWDAVWWVATRRVADGWIAEIRIPFKALRFEPSERATWGINFSRRIRRKNELTYWSLIPRAYTFARMSLGGDLIGLDAGTPGRDLRLKPYVAGSTVRPTGGTFDQSGDIGVDFKGALTSSLTLDATVNPDFAQAEADEQQVNLTQFSQFFPEKRGRGSPAVLLEEHWARSRWHAHSYSPSPPQHPEELGRRSDLHDARRDQPG